MEEGRGTALLNPLLRSTQEGDNVHASTSLPSRANMGRRWFTSSVDASSGSEEPELTSGEQHITISIRSADSPAKKKPQHRSLAFPKLALSSSSGSGSGAKRSLFARSISTEDGPDIANVNPQCESRSMLWSKRHPKKGLVFVNKQCCCLSLCTSSAAVASTVLLIAFGLLVFFFTPREPGVSLISPVQPLFDCAVDDTPVQNFTASFILDNSDWTTLQVKTLSVKLMYGDFKLHEETMKHELTIQRRAKSKAIEVTLGLTDVDHTAVQTMLGDCSTYGRITVELYGSVKFSYLLTSNTYHSKTEATILCGDNCHNEAPC